MFNKKMRILIIEDEEPIRVGLEDVFVYHGFSVETAAEGTDGLRKARSGGFDMILLDLMLPGMDGFEICRRIRSRDSDQAIIMLTALTSDDDIVRGLELGADDYVAKPFSVTQLVLRVKAVLRRAGIGNTPPSHIRLGSELELDVLNLSGRRGKSTLSFTRREMDILGYLYCNAERPVSREELLHKVWGYARDLRLETRTVDVHIAQLRRKIEPEPTKPCHLVTVRGAGYRLIVD